MRRFVLAAAAVLAMSSGGAVAALAANSSSSSGIAGADTAGTTASTASPGSTAAAGATTASSTITGVANWASEGVAVDEDVLPGLAKAVFLRPTPSDTMMTLAVGLQQPDQTAEAQRIAAEYDPSSPAYHQFLPPAVFDQMFGVPQATVQSTENWLESAGLKIGYVSPAGDLVQARGTSAQIAALMKTSFGDYRAGSIGFIANQTPATIPKALPITVVSGLNTLQRVWTPQQVAQAEGQKVSANLPGAGSRSQSSCPGVTSSNPAGNTNSNCSVVGTVLPQDAWGVYDTPLNALAQQSGSGDSLADLNGPTLAKLVDGNRVDAGQGEISGMFGAGYVNGVVSVLRVYEQRTGLPQVPVREVLESDFSPNATPSDNDVLGDDEWDLDNEAISSMAPGLTQLDQYFASTEYDADMGVTFNDWANDPLGPAQMNASFGECEAVPEVPSQVDTFVDQDTNYGVDLVGEDFEVLADPSLEQAVAEGRTLITAAGDTGGSCPAVELPILGGGNGVNPQPAPTDQAYPCVSVYALCVGGTVVTTDGTTDPTLANDPANEATANPDRVDEQSWAFTGGGPAAFVPEPSWQQGVAAIDKPCTSPLSESGSVITPGTICRGVPDVAAMSGTGLTDGEVVGANGYYLSIDDMPISTGGTSLSSPLTVGMWSLIEAAAPETTQCTAANAKDQCTATAPTYGLGFADYAIYKDAQTSNYSRDFYDITSSDLPTGNFYEQPGAGWDYTSGWGALDVSHFIQDVDGNQKLSLTHAAAGRGLVAPEVNDCEALQAGPLDNAFDLLITPPVGSYTEDPELNITWSSMTVKGDTLQVVIGGPGPSMQGPPDDIDGYNFYATWAYDGTTYTAFAAVNDPGNTPAESVPGVGGLNSVPAPVSAPTGAVAYGDGVLETPTGTASYTPTEVHVDTGSFTANSVGGYFTIDVPLPNVGNPKAGAQLLYPFIWDTLPNGVLVPTAMDEAVSDPPGQVLQIDGNC